MDDLTAKKIFTELEFFKFMDKIGVDFDGKFGIESNQRKVSQLFWKQRAFETAELSARASEW